VRTNRNAKTVVIVTAVLALGAAVTIGLTGPSSGSSSQRTNSDPLQPPTISETTTPNPWLQFATSVHPNSLIQFANSSDGWKVDGQSLGPYQYGNLSAGPVGTTFQWPGSSVSSTTDGGSTWSKVLSAPDGVWGVDLLSSTSGVVVGVTTLYSTNDAGESWSVIPEPTGSTIVSATFSTLNEAIAIQADGSIVATSDGGLTWRSLSAPFTATSLCMVSDSNGYSTDSSGTVYATDDSGIDWTKVFSSPTPSGTIMGVWSSVSCSQSGIAVDVSSFLVQNAGASNFPYEVAVGSDSASSWQIVSPGSTLNPGSAQSSATASGPDWPSDIQAAGIDEVGDVALSGQLLGSSSVEVVEIPNVEPGASQSNVTLAQIASGNLSPAEAGGSATLVNGLSMADGKTWLYTTSPNGAESLGVSIFSTASTHNDWTAEYESVIPQPSSVPLSSQTTPTENQSVSDSSN
jgi:photosystem II stability/assembly factor-like uncharacterized protein